MQFLFPQHGICYVRTSNNENKWKMKIMVPITIYYFYCCYHETKTNVKKCTLARLFRCFFYTRFCHGSEGFPSILILFVTRQKEVSTCLRESRSFYLRNGKFYSQKDVKLFLTFAFLLQQPNYQVKRLRKSLNLFVTLSVQTCELNHVYAKVIGKDNQIKCFTKHSSNRFLKIR